MDIVKGIFVVFFQNVVQSSPQQNNHQCLSSLMHLCIFSIPTNSPENIRLAEYFFYFC